MGILKALKRRYKDELEEIRQGRVASRIRRKKVRAVRLKERELQSIRIAKEREKNRAERIIRSFSPRKGETITYPKRKKSKSNPNLTEVFGGKSIIWGN